MEAARVPLDERTHRHLRGACCHDAGWLACWLGTYLAILVAVWSTASRDRHLAAVPMFCSVLTCVLVPTVAYWRMGRERGVAIGLLVDFFWWGGVGGVFCAGLGDRTLVAIYHFLSPGCAIRQKNPAALNKTTLCQAGQQLQWIFGDGLSVELSKSVWIALRIKTKPWWTETVPPREPVPTVTCCCFPTRVCTFWYRLAGTPEAVFLCALSAGAGFESIPNALCMINPVEEAVVKRADVVQLSASSMIYSFTFSFMTILWTGCTGLRLAQRLFAEPDRKPSLFAAFLPAMAMHGLWQWVVLDGRHNPPVLPGPLKPLLLLLLLALSLGLCYKPVREGALRADARASVVANEMELRAARPARGGDAEQASATSG